MIIRIYDAYEGCNVSVYNVPPDFSPADVEHSVRLLASEGNPTARQALSLVKAWVPLNVDWRTSRVHVYLDDY